MIGHLSLVIIGITAFFASGLTLFSGFGLGTLLMPVMALFMPIEAAIVVTAIVHLANNIFKFTLLAKNANWEVVSKFGIPAVIFALFGGYLLSQMGGHSPWFYYDLFDKMYMIYPIKFVIGMLIAIFALLELWPKFKNLAIDKKFLPVGGILAGFFGGLSGIQGAFRSMFLIKAGLSKEAFIATGVVLAVLVDCARLLTYGASSIINPFVWSVAPSTIIVPCLAAFFGVTIAKAFAEKVTIEIVQNIVAIGLFMIGISLAFGLV